MMTSEPRRGVADPIGVLTEAECRRLLGTRSLGRVAITSGGLPYIVVVWYRYDDGAVVFRTGTDTKLRAAATGDVVAFEVDSYDCGSGEGWSVQVLGRASVEAGRYVRLDSELITGTTLPACAAAAQVPRGVIPAAT